MPLDQVQETADTLATRHYQNLASASQLEILANNMKAKLLPGARDYVDKHINSLQSALQDMAKNGGENSTARINALATALQGDEPLLRGLQQAERVNKELDIEQQLLAQGKQPIRKTGVRESMMSAAIDSELYKTPYQSTVEPYENPVPHMESIWSKVNPDSIESMIRAAKNTEISKLLPGAYVNGQLDLPLFFESVTKAGISPEKITGLLESAWSSYRQTPSYRQQKDLLGKDDKTMKKEFYDHGLIRVFENLSRDYKPTPAWAGNDGSGNSQQGSLPTTVPAQALETMFNYTEQGKYPAKLEPETSLGHNKMVTLDMGKGKEEYHPQYVQDYKTMLEINGDNTNVEPGSEKARAAAKQYKELVQKRVSNPWVQTFSKEQASDLNDQLRREFALSEYLDPINPNKVVRPFDNNGNMTDEFVELTGGDPKAFTIESVYDPKNHYSVTSNEKFVKPVAMTAVDKDGKVRRFLMSQHPMNTSTQDINTNKIYTKVNLRPGQWTDLGQGIKARELHGAQLKDFNQEDIAKTTMPIEATVDNKTYLFDSPDHLSRYLISIGKKLN